jgi:threonine aldolase
MRRMLGGRLTKAGVAAAACLVALETMVDRLQDDHRTAFNLSAAIADTPGLTLETGVVTNIVRFDTSRLAPAAELVQELASRGVRMGAVGPYSIRAVTHRHISDADIDSVTTALADAVESLRATSLAASPAA